MLKTLSHREEKKVKKRGVGVVGDDVADEEGEEGKRVEQKRWRKLQRRIVEVMVTVKGKDIIIIMILCSRESGAVCDRDTWSEVIWEIGVWYGVWSLHASETTAHKLTHSLTSKHSFFLFLFLFLYLYALFLTSNCGFFSFLPFLSLQTPKGRCSWYTLGLEKDRLFPVIIEQRCSCVLQIFLTTGFLSFVVFSTLLCSVFISLFYCLLFNTQIRQSFTIILT